MPRIVGNSTVYDLQEIASMLRIHVHTLCRYVRTGRLRAARVGKYYLVTEENLKEFLMGKTIQGMILDKRKSQRRKETLSHEPERRVAERRREDIFHPASRG